MGIPCEVCKDLLPSYVDGLTSDATNALLNAHLEACPTCKAALDGMRAPDGTEQEADASREIDYLKKQKRRTRRIVLSVVLGAVLLMLLALFVNVFVIGSPVTDGVYCKVQVDGTHLTLDATETGSAGVISAIRFSEKDGVVTVRMRRVLVGLLRGTNHAEYEAAGEIREVRFNDVVLWRNGMEAFVYPKTLRDSAAKLADRSVSSSFMLDSAETWAEGAAKIGAPAWNPLETEAWLERELFEGIPVGNETPMHVLISCIVAPDGAIGSAVVSASYAGDGVRVNFVAEIENPAQGSYAYSDDPEARWLKNAEETRPLGKNGTIYITRTPSYETMADGDEPPTGEMTDVNGTFLRGNVAYGLHVSSADPETTEKAFERLIRCLADAD